ncbi:MAG: cell division protein SepF [Oscillospiraceae bacterium]|jgi:FtsZ-interacting cell division protein YlmF|nr:cell division protein SepF [Oscillospiraceae bacterium]
MSKIRENISSGVRKILDGEYTSELENTAGAVRGGSRNSRYYVEPEQDYNYDEDNGYDEPEIPSSNVSTVNQYGGSGFYSTLSERETTTVVKNDSRDGTAGVKITMCKPLAFSQVAKIAEYYQQGRLVTLNFENTEKEHMYRILDFFAGMVFDSKGKMHRISENVFIAVQRGVHVTDDTIAQISSMEKDSK